MAARAFVDTNVFIYADDADAGAKQHRAQEVLGDLIAAGGAVLSTQVLQEFFVVATRKLGMTAEAARRRVEAMTQLDVVLVRPELVLAAVDLHRLHKISFWDALVIKCASAAGCTRLLSEDLGDGQIIDGVRIENPFAATPRRAPHRTR